MTNLPTSGQGNSLDNFNVDRADYRQGMQNLLAFLAEGLGGIPVGTFTTQAVDPAQVNAALGWTRTGTTLAPKTAGDIVNISAGTAAAPGLAFPTHPTTGIFAPAADNFAISAGGVERLTVSTWGVGLGGAPKNANAHVQIYAPMTGTATQKGINNVSKILRDVTGSVTYYDTYAETEAAPFVLGAIAHYLADQGQIGAGSRIDTQSGFAVSPNLVGATKNYGFVSNIPFGANRWNFYSGGTADSHFSSNNFIFANGGAERARFDPSGKLLIGASVAQLDSGHMLEANSLIGTIGPFSGFASFETPAGKGFRWTLSNNGTFNLQSTTDGFRTPGLVKHPITVRANGTVSLGNVVAHADNTAAKAAGLVAGDIYRKADGTLMIAF